MKTRTILLILAMTVAAVAQSPVLSQGRDYTNNVNRTMSVDAMGRLNVNGGGGGGGCSSPCVVIGATAAGSVVGAGANPLLIGIASPGGRARQAFSPSAVPDGDSGNSTLAVAGNLFNGTTWDRKFSCTLSQPIAASAATDVRIVTGSGSTKVRICHISFSGDTSAVVTLRQGTQMTTACDTGTATMTGGYQNTVALALDFNAESALTTAAGQDVCIHFSTAVTAGGVVNYAQF